MRAQASRRASRSAAALATASSPKKKSPTIVLKISHDASSSRIEVRHSRRRRATIVRSSWNAAAPV